MSAGPGPTEEAGSAGRRAEAVRPEHPTGGWRERRIRDYFLRQRGEFMAGFAALVATNALALVLPWLLKLAVDALGRGEPERARQFALALAAVALGGAVIRVASRLLIFNAGRKVEYDLRNELYDHLLALPQTFYARRPVGDVMSRCVNDLGQVRMVLGPGLLNAVNTAVAYAVGLTMLFALSPRLALWALLPYPLVLVLARAASGAIYRRMRGLQDSMGDLTARLQENLSGQAVVKAYVQEDAELRAFEKRNADYYQRSVGLAFLRGALVPLFGSAAGVGMLAVLFVGGREVAADHMTLGDFVAFSGYLAALAWPTIALGWILSIFQRGRAAMNRINELFAAEPQPRGADERGAEAAASGAGDVELRALTFVHEGARGPALDGISLRIPAGSTLAVVGPTGAGKSTLALLLVRLHDPPAGTVFVDGVDVRDWPLGSLRRAVVLASQDPFLFSATVHENVAFGRPEAPRPEVESAARAARLDGDVARFPHGFDTLVGERGITLSGGQRQRAAIARALLLDPRVLVLDDPLSSVDAETADAILRELKTRLRGRTGVLVTHRIAAAREMDRIAVLEGGRLVELGTHDELAARGGLYAKLWQKERLAAELEMIA